MTAPQVIPLWQPGAKVGDAVVSPIVPDDFRLNEAVVPLIAKAVARELLVVPLAVSPLTLVVAAVSPVDPESIDRLQFVLNRRVRVVPMSRDWIERQIDHYYRTGDGRTDAS